MMESSTSTGKLAKACTGFLVTIEIGRQGGRLANSQGPFPPCSDPHGTRGLWDTWLGLFTLRPSGHLSQLSTLVTSS